MLIRFILCRMIRHRRFATLVIVFFRVGLEWLVILLFWCSECTSVLIQSGFLSNFDVILVDCLLTFLDLFHSNDLLSYLIWWPFLIRQSDVCLRHVLMIIQCLIVGGIHMHLIWLHRFVTTLMVWSMGSIQQVSIIQDTRLIGVIWTHQKYFVLIRFVQILLLANIN